MQFFFRILISLPRPGLNQKVLKSFMHLELFLPEAKGYCLAIWSKVMCLKGVEMTSLSLWSFVWRRRWSVCDSWFGLGWPQQLSHEIISFLSDLHNKIQYLLLDCTSGGLLHMESWSLLLIEVKKYGHISRTVFCTATCKLSWFLGMFNSFIKLIIHKN